MNVDEMPAGPEMDRLIGEKICGWHWIRCRSSDSNDPTVYRWLVRPNCYPNFQPATGLEPIGEGSGYNMPHYSTDIAVVWELLKALMPVTLEQNGHDGNYYWRVYRSNLDEPGYWGEADNLPEAICRAAYKAATQ